MKKVKVLFKYYKNTQSNSWEFNNGVYFLSEKEEVMTEQEYKKEYVSIYNDTLVKDIKVNIDGVSFVITKVPMKISEIENDK